MSNPLYGLFAPDFEDLLVVQQGKQLRELIDGAIRAGRLSLLYDREIYDINLNILRMNGFKVIKTPRDMNLNGTPVKYTVTWSDVQYKYGSQP